jgi:hypothetical protein
VEGVNSSMIYLIYCNFCKCYNVPPLNITSKKKKERKRKEINHLRIYLLCLPNRGTTLHIKLSQVRDRFLKEFSNLEKIPSFRVKILEIAKFWWVNK